MLKSLLTKSKALFSVGAIAVIATIAIAAVVLVRSGGRHRRRASA